MKSKDEIRVAGVIMGDILHDPHAGVKYGLLFKALEQRFAIEEVCNANLQGSKRLLNALQTFHINRAIWRERFYKNVPAFLARSRQVVTRLQLLGDRVDVALQVGVLFDASWGESPLPTVIYTDYTAHLSAQKLLTDRLPLTPRQHEKWITLEQQAFRRAAHICTRSQLVRASILDHYGIEPERVTVVGGGVNFEKLPKINDLVKKAGPTVLFIGKQLYRKGGDLLLLAFAQARTRVPDARLLLVTEDPISPELPLAGVKVIKSTWDRSIIATLYRQADLFVLPSRLETWGDVLLEAMAYQLPCIGVAGEAMEEIIQDKVTGLVVPPGDVDALASALTCLLSDPSLRQRWGQSARRRVEQEYTWDRVAERLAPAIKAAVEQSKPGCSIAPDDPLL